MDVQKVVCCLLLPETGNKPLKFGEIQNFSKNAQKPLWGIEPRPIVPESGVLTTIPCQSTMINDSFSEIILGNIDVRLKDK